MTASAPIQHKRSISSVIAILVIASAGLMSSCTPQTTNPTPPAVWTLHVIVKVPNTMVAEYGGSTAMQTKVAAQLATVASNFVGFKAKLNIVIQEYHEFAVTPFWSTYDEAYTAHPPGTLLLVYSDTADLPVGWIGDAYSIHWDWRYTPDIFEDWSTKGLTHEFGHVFGAVDEYNLEALTNPVSESQYRVDPNYMSNPYQFPVWDSWTVGLINKANGQISSHGQEVTSSLPTMYQVQAKNGLGAPVSGAQTKMYPVEWRSMTVSSTPTYTGFTSSDGTWTLPANPFGAGTPGFAWDTRTPTYLVEVRNGTVVSYSWLSLVTAGTFYFQHPGQTMPIPATVG